MSVTVNQIRAGFYLDSVAFMRLSVLVKEQPGVIEAALMIGSDSNKQILHDAGLLGDTESTEQAGPNDLIIGVRAHDQSAATFLGFWRHAVDVGDRAHAIDTFQVAADCAR